MVLRETLDSKLSSVFIVSFLFHKNATTQRYTTEYIPGAFNHIPTAFVMTPRRKSENDDEGQMWRRKTEQ